MSDPLAPAPVLVQIELTSVCNLKCTMCPLTTGDTASSVAPGAMSGETWASARAVAERIGRVELTGFGEPLLNKDFLACLRELDALGVQLSFSTNGSAVTPDVVAELAALRGLVAVNVSIDSPDPIVYRALRGGDLALALRGAMLLKSGLSIAVGVSSVVMASNAASLKGFPRILRELGIRDYVLQSLQPWNEGLDAEQVTAGRRDPTCLADIRVECAQHGVRLHLQRGARLELELAAPARALELYQPGSRFPAGKTRQCMAPWDSPFIDKDGRVLPCCHGDATAVMGDLHEETFEEIWTGPRFEAFRRALIAGVDAPSICRRCSVVPVGRHPLADYSAAIVPELSGWSSPSALRLVAKNTGSVPWDRTTLVRLGTAHPRDRLSPGRGARWLSDNRSATMEEERVEPGGNATFLVLLGPGSQGRLEHFQLVVEGVAWLPDTLFEACAGAWVRPAAPADTPRAPPRGTSPLALPPPISDESAPGRPPT